MIAGTVSTLALGYWMFLLAIQGWKGVFAVLIFFFPIWLSLVHWTYDLAPIAAMNVHRDMGGPLARHFERASEIQANSSKKSAATTATTGRYGPSKQGQNPFLEHTWPLVAQESSSQTISRLDPFLPSGIGRALARRDESALEPHRD